MKGFWWWEIFYEKVLMKTTKNILSQGYNETPQKKIWKSYISSSVAGAVSFFLNAIVLYGTTLKSYRKWLYSS